MVTSRVRDATESGRLVLGMGPLNKLAGLSNSEDVDMEPPRKKVAAPPKAHPPPVQAPVATPSHVEAATAPPPQVPVAPQVPQVPVALSLPRPSPAAPMNRSGPKVEGPPPSSHQEPHRTAHSGAARERRPSAHEEPDDTPKLESTRDERAAEQSEKRRHEGARREAYEVGKRKKRISTKAKKENVALATMGVMAAGLAVQAARAQVVAGKEAAEAQAAEAKAAEKYAHHPAQLLQGRPHQGFPTGHEERRSTHLPPASPERLRDARPIAGNEQLHYSQENEKLMFSRKRQPEATNAHAVARETPRAHVAPAHGTRGHPVQVASKPSPQAPAAHVVLVQERGLGEVQSKPSPQAPAARYVVVREQGHRRGHVHTHPHHLKRREVGHKYVVRKDVVYRIPSHE
jgi:hypothetical protein